MEGKGGGGGEGKGEGGGKEEEGKWLRALERGLFLSTPTDFLMNQCLFLKW